MINNTLHQNSCSDLMETSKALWHAKAKRDQHHETSFTTNVKGTSLGEKEKAMNKNKKIMK